MSIDLQRLQLEMQRAIMTDAHAPTFVQGRDASDRACRFGIYATAYRSRLTEALAHNFPMLQSHLGEASWAPLASAYIDTHPSVHASIRAFGDRLAAWLEETRPEAPWLAELAHLEWMLGCAFDAPDDRPMSMDALAGIEPSQWAMLRFHFARSVRRLTCHTNAPTLYEHITSGAADMRGERAAQPEPWLIWRQQLTARYRSMTSAEALAFDALARGETFGDMCALLLEYYSDDDAPLQAAACLKRWLADELVVAFSFAPA
jgi:hypothetical protein